MSDKPTITQADRDALADATAYMGFLSFIGVQNIRSGDCTAGEKACAIIAAYRESAVAELRAENERLSKTLSPRSGACHKTEAAVLREQRDELVATVVEYAQSLAGAYRKCALEIAEICGRTLAANLQSALDNANTALAQKEPVNDPEN